jgi:hypothetical protein
MLASAKVGDKRQQPATRKWGHADKAEGPEIRVPTPGSVFKAVKTVGRPAKAMNRK